MVKKNKKNEKYSIKEKLLFNILDKINYHAILYNDNGEQVADIKLKRDCKTFKYLECRYNVKFDNETYFKRNTIFSTHKYFSYNLDNPDPIVYNKEKNNFECVFDPNVYNIMLETKVAKDLNNVGVGLLDKLTMKTALIILGVIGAIIYFATGGTLT